MLVLSRKAGERIHIGNDISIEVRRIAGNRVTIALHAPREVRILRGELQEAADAFQEESPMKEVAAIALDKETPSLCTIEQVIAAAIASPAGASS